MTNCIPDYESFHVYSNGDGTFHIVVVKGGGGFIFADNINDEDSAEWIASLLNAAIGNVKA